MTFNTEHGHKQIIRQKWATPILKFLNKQLGHKLLYLGLPSPEAEDVLAWLDYLKKVIAFQCDDDRYPNAFEQLFEKLKQFEQEEKIEDFEAYYGYIEKVILQGIDDNENPQSFELDEVVTLYNLDFCNNITVPIKILDENGNLRKMYKFDAVRKLLSIQQSFPNSSKFVFFLTVHCSYAGLELNNYLEPKNNSNNQGDYIKNVREQLKGRGTEINARIVRLFVIDTLSHLFKSFGFVPKFLPTILYQGINDTPLLTFTVVGVKVQSAGITPWLQQLGDLIQQKFVTINEEQDLICHSVLDNEVDIPQVDAVQIISSSPTFQKYWQKINA